MFRSLPYLLALTLWTCSGLGDCELVESPPPERVDVAHGTRARITRVVDGDTLKVRLADGREESVRVLGIDCFESRPNSKCRAEGERGGLDCEAQRPLGQAATHHAKKLVRKSEVVLEGPNARAPERDRYGRILAYVRLPDGSDFGLHMVRDAPCKDYGDRYPHPRGAEYRKASP